MQIQKYEYKIHKYTNTAYDKVPERPNMWHIFEERIVQGYQKMIFPCVKHASTKIQIHKYTNTQTQHMTNCHKDPTYIIFLKRGLFKYIKNDIPMSQTRKYWC